jgi:hypothetical protein
MIGRYVVLAVGVGVDVFGVITATATHPNVRRMHNPTIPSTIIFVDNPNTICFHLGTRLCSYIVAVKTSTPSSGAASII